MLEKAVASRTGLFDARHESAIRLFNGFYEGNAGIAVDLYAKTAVIHDYAAQPEQSENTAAEITHTLQAAMPWLKTIILKTRNSPLPEKRNGEIVFGTDADSKVKENGIWYAVDLCMNRDASLYLDTRNLREWTMRRSSGKTVLNTFAYTGSLGVAALAGGATRVVQLDRNRLFFEITKKSYSLNRFKVNKKDFMVGDFWTLISRLKYEEARFDCIFVDPPFFAVTPNGVVDMENNSARLINKVRPLINDGGHLVSINNAVYVSGKEYLEALEKLCADGYLKIAELIDVPSDFTGGAGTGAGLPITDPAPFNHSTKIAILEVRRK